MQRYRFFYTDKENNNLVYETFSNSKTTAYNRYKARYAFSNVLDKVIVEDAVSCTTGKLKQFEFSFIVRNITRKITLMARDITEAINLFKVMYSKSPFLNVREIA